MGGKKISMQVRNLVVHDHLKQVSQRKIAEKFEITRGVVREIVQKHNTYGSLADRSRRGRRRKTDSRTDQRIIREVKKSPIISVIVIQENLSLAVSTRTERRRLADME